MEIFILAERAREAGYHPFDRGCRPDRTVPPHTNPAPVPQDTLYRGSPDILYTSLQTARDPGFPAPDRVAGLHLILHFGLTGKGLDSLNFPDGLTFLDPGFLATFWIVKGLSGCEQRGLKNGVVHARTYR